MSHYIFYVTVPNMDEGKKIAKALVKNKHAACVNIVPNITSIYEWKGALEQDSEHLLIIKTTQIKADSLIKSIKDLHSYEEPECIGVKVEKGSESYLKWIKSVVES